MKIINVASSDNFQDILEAVRVSESVSIILVIPKSNRVFKSKIKVEELKNQFKRLGKDVSVISSGREVIENADLAGLNILREAVKLTDKTDSDITSLYKEPLPEEKPVKKNQSRIEKKSLNKKLVLIFLSAALISFVIVAFTLVGQAKVKITPRKKDFSINIPIIISDKITRVDEVYGMIPGELVQLEKVVSKTFTSSGEKDVFQKAKGRITIYNNFGTSSQILAATTRFQIATGLVFRIPKSITVPGLVKVGGEVKPGEIEVEVAADRAGEEYNIEPAEFKIPGFLGSLKYQGFSAKSFKKFSGGFIGQSKFVTKDDISKAEELVRQEAINGVKNELSSLANFKILEEAVEIEVETNPDSARVGDLVGEFKISLKSKAKALAFKESDIADFVSQYIDNSQNLKVLKSSLNASYSEPKLDKKRQELSLKLGAFGKTMENIDKDKIISGILGKKGKEIKEYLGSLKEVESAQVFISPFWIKSIPENQDMVRVEVIEE